MEIEKSIAATKKEFEKSFHQAVLYNSQTRNQKHLDMILDLIPIKENDTILDLGTGSGYLSFALAKKFGEANVIGLDIVEETLKCNREQAAAQNIGNLSFITYEGINFPLDDRSVDVIYCRYAFHHFPDAVHKFEEMRRVLKPGGKIFISDPTPNEDDTEGFADAFMQVKKDGHIKFYREQDYERLANIVEMHVRQCIQTEIRFSRKNIADCHEVFDQFSKEVIAGYKIEETPDWIYITEQVLNVVIS